MRLVVFVDEFTLRAPLHGVLLDSVVSRGPRNRCGSVSVSRSKESTPIRKTNTMEITGGLVLCEFLGNPPDFERFRSVGEARDAKC